MQSGRDLIRHWLALLLPRWLAVALAIRRLTPRPGELPPFRIAKVPPIDTGGTFRPTHREQDPGVDPKEPYEGEGSNAGQDHGWNGCTMTSGGMALGYQLHDQDPPWGGKVRHSQGSGGDYSGGTDLYDLRDAWANGWEQELKIRSGNGWEDLKAKRAEGRAIVVQGSGNVPGTESYSGGHACIIGPESNSAGDWLWGDPLASGWQYVPPGKIRDWMEDLCGSGLCYAVTRRPDTEPEPPEPIPEPPEPPPPAPEPEPPARYVDPAYWRGPGPSEGVTATWDVASWDDGAWAGSSAWPHTWPYPIPTWSQAPWGGQWSGA